jgi:hypothetical protein
MRPLLAMARVTFAETIRQPFFGLVVIGTLGALALGPALAMFSLEDDRPLLKDFGVSTVFLAGSILAAFGASTILAREFERHTLQTILSKPVSRAALLLGKLLGLLAALALAVFLFLLALLLADRHGPPAAASSPWDVPVLVGGFGGAFAGVVLALIVSLRTSRPFSAVAVKTGAATLLAGTLFAAVFDPGWHLQALGRGFDPLLPRAVLAVFLGLVVISSVALLLGTFLRRGTLLGTILVFLAGLVLGGADRPWLLFIPDLQLFWIGDAYYRPQPSLPAEYLLSAAGYALSYSLVCLMVGVWRLRRSEVG